MHKIRRLNSFSKYSTVSFIIFSKVSSLFFHVAQRVLLVLLQGYFKKADVQFKCNNLLRNEDRKQNFISIPLYF